jgi:hypothetical protein
MEAIENLAVLYATEGLVWGSRTAVHLSSSPQTARAGGGSSAHPACDESPGEMYRDQGQGARAEPLFLRVLVRRRLWATSIPTHWILWPIWRSCTTATANMAEPLYARVLEVRRRVVGENHPDTATFLASMGAPQLRQKRFAEAGKLLRAALHSFENTIPDAPQRCDSQSLWPPVWTVRRSTPRLRGSCPSDYQGMLYREAAIPAAYRAESEQAGK